MDLPVERRRFGLAQRSLGEQLDQWCDMLASASAAVGFTPRVASVLGVGPAVPGIHVPRPPDVPRPVQRTLQDSLIRGHLTDLNLPKTDNNGKPPSGIKSSKGGGQVRRKSLKKMSANSKEAKKKNENKSKPKVKVRSKSRLQIVTSNSTPSFPVQTSPKKTSHEKISALIAQRGPKNYSAVLPTLHYSESESDCSDSDSECGAVKTRTPNTSPVGMALRSTLHRPTCKSLTNLALDHGRKNELSELLPLQSPKKIGLHGALSKSTSNLTRLPEVVSPRGDRRNNKERNLPVASQSAEKLGSRSNPSFNDNNAKDSKVPKGESQTPVVETPVKTPEKKKKIKPSMISLVKPLNQDTEKEKFMHSKNYAYNPQFEYKNPIEHSSYKRQFKPEYRLIPLALKILYNALLKHGTYEKFAMHTGGRELTPDQIKALAVKYLKEEGLEDEVCIKLSPDLVSRACMTRVKGRPLLQVQTNNVHEGWMAGLLRHEIGTHYLRSCNNRCQVWRKKKKRRELEMDHQNPTEEGLASLHSVIFRDDPILFRAAMLYYTVARGSDMSFSALFHDIQKFVKDPAVRWDYCVRAKRGFTDTSVPGAFAKDQVYLKGALEILKHRKFIDFHALLRLGKVSYLDVDRIMPQANLENTRIPRFMQDLKHYHIKLNSILVKNGLTDDDLQKV